MQTTIKARSINVGNTGEPRHQTKAQDLLLNSNGILPKPRIKVKSAQNLPDRRKFWVIAKTCPIIREQIKSMTWNVAKNTLRLTIQEDGNFTAFVWFSTLNSRREELSKSPFNDLEQDAIALCFLNLASEELARWKLSGLQLLDHECALATNEETTSLRPLTHDITIMYDKLERLESHRQEENEEFLTAEEIADEEWSEVNLVVKEDVNVSISP